MISHSSVGTSPDEPSGLVRSKTTLNVPSNARELTSGGGDGGDSPRSAGGAPVRSNTMLSTTRAPPGAGIGGPVRGLSVRRGGSPPGSNKPLAAAPPPPAKGTEGSRLTEIYDDYLDSYAEEAPPMPNAPPDRVAAWARSNASPASAPPPSAFVQRSGSRSAPTSNYAPSSYGGGGSVRRRVTRRNTRRIQSAYEEEEEGYASGEDFDGPFELIKIRVKVRIPHFGLFAR